MTDRATLEALIARVLEGTGPDRELDRDITKLLLPTNAEYISRSTYGWSYRVFGPDGWDDEWLESKPYTASLDAALTLVPEGCEWLRKTPQTMTVYRIPDDPKEWARHIDIHAAAPIRALIAACLKARMEAQGE